MPDFDQLGRLMTRLGPVLALHVGGWLVLRRLWRPTRRVALGFVAGMAIAGLGLVLPVVATGTRHGRVPFVGQPLRWFGWFWLCSLAVLCVVGAAYVVARSLAMRGRRRAREIDPARRMLLTRFGQAVPVAAMATGSSGLVEGARSPVLREIEVRVPDLPGALEGFRIGHTTDVHVGPFVTPADLARYIGRLDAAGVDLQVMTGDLLNDLGQLEPCLAALGSVKAPHGLVAIPGNHEHWTGIRRIRAGYERLAVGGAKVRFLEDDSLVLEHGGARVRVVGVDFPLRMRGATKDVMRASAERAFRDVQPGETVLCLSHHPEFFPFAAERGAALQLSGHTHGGQVSILGFRPIAQLQYAYTLGLYRRGDASLYVGAGTGHWFPFRLGTPAEMAVITLRRG